MNKKEVFEIKRRFKKEQASFSRIAGCYVNGDHQKVLTFSEMFLNQDEDVFYKYLEIANKTLSGTINNQLLNLEFPLSEEAAGGRQQLLMAIRESALTNEALLDSWYDLVISELQLTGNYLILLYADKYDVPMKTKDLLNLGESEEIFSYILCAVCPVALSQPALSFLESEGRIGARLRDWIVGAPELGFLFPSFNHRSTDIHETLFFTKKPLEPHREFMEKVLGCETVLTDSEKRQTFHNIVKKTLGQESEETEHKLLGIQRSLSDINEDYEEAYADTSAEPMRLTKEAMYRAFSENHLTEDQSAKIIATVERTFEAEIPDTAAVIDARALRSGELKLENRELLEELAAKTLEAEHLKKELSVTEARIQESTAAEVRKTLPAAPGLRLRPFKNMDAETILSWLTDERVFRYWCVDRYPNYPAKPEEMIEKYRSEENTDNVFPMTACDEQGIFGHLIFRYPTEDKTTVRLGFIVVDNTRRGQGLGKKLLSLAIRYAKEFLGAQTITLGVVDGNAPAERCYLSSGFVFDETVPSETIELLGEACQVKEMIYKG